MNFGNNSSFCDIEDVNSAITKRENDPMFIVLDVRTIDEFQQGHIPQAINIDYFSDDFLEEIKALDKKKSYIIYCHSGSRASKTMEMMKKEGFLNISAMKRGFSAWKSAGYRVSY